MKYISKKLFIIPFISFLLAIFAYPQLPEQIPTHFNFSGVPDAYSSKLFVFMMPLLSFVLTALAEVMPKLDPKSQNYERFPKAYQYLHIVTNLLFLFVNLFIILYSMEIMTVNIGYFVSFFVGVMIIIFGNYMPKFKQNFFCGIKTPWTLSDEENWFKTHRFCGKVWIIGGLLIIFTPYLGEKLGIIFVILDAFLLVIIPCVYSYLLFQKKQNK